MIFKVKAVIGIFAVIVALILYSELSTASDSYKMSDSGITNNANQKTNNCKDRLSCLVSQKDAAALSVLDACIDESIKKEPYLLGLIACKESLKSIVSECKFSEQSQMNICQDSKLSSFLNEIDHKISYVQKSDNGRTGDVLGQFNYLNQKSIEYCSNARVNSTLNGCKQIMNQIKSDCNTFGNVESCSDLRINSILYKKPVTTPDIFESTNQGILEFLDTCEAMSKFDGKMNQRCIDTAQKIFLDCDLESPTMACTDKRLAQIASS